MPDQSQQPQVFRFGVFEVDARAGELRKNGIKLKLQEQPFQVLCMLVEHAGEVVTREDLRIRLWPAETFVDFDHGLNAALRLQAYLLHRDVNSVLTRMGKIHLENTSGEEVLARLPANWDVEICRESQSDVRPQAVVKLA